MSTRAVPDRQPAARQSRPRADALDPAEAARRKALEHRKLQRMIDYAGTQACLRATILRYFGDPAVREPCASCSTCTPGAVDPFERHLVRRILGGIVRAGERYGRHRIVSMLVGDTRELPPALANLPTTGLLRLETRETVHEWIQAAIAARLVAVSKDEYRTLSVTSDGRRFMQTGADDVRILRPGPPPVLSTRTGASR